MRLAVAETETEDLFKTLANESPVGLCIIQDGKFCYTNPTFRHNTGYREDELLGRDSLEFIVPEDREMVRENAIKMLKGELTSPGQFRVIHKDGSIHWIMGSVSSIQYHGRRATLGNFVDITERRQAEEALQAERNKLQALVDAMEYGLTIQDKDYNIIYQNTLLRRIFGDHPGEKCYRVYEGRDKLCNGCPVKKAFEDGKSHTSVRRVVMPSGDVDFWENTANPIRDAGGRIVSCLELTRDITERKQAEEKLKDATQKWTSLVENTSDFIMIVDSKGKIQYINRAIPPHNVDHVVGKTLYDFAAPEHHEVMRKAVAKVFETGEEAGYESSVKHPTGVLSFETVIIPIVEGGKVISAISFNEDITERKEAEKKLRESEEKYKTIFEDVSEVIIRVDRYGKIVDINGRAEECFGYKPEEVIGKNFAKIGVFSLKEMPKIVKLFGEIIRGKRAPIVIELEAKRKDGSPILIEVNSKLVKKNGKAEGFVAIVRDITERKQAEEKLRENEESLTTAQRIARMGSWDLDLAKGKGTWSAEMFRLTGLDPSKGPPSYEEFLEWVHPEDQQHFSSDFHDRVRQTGKSATAEFRSNPARGPVRNFLANASATRDAQGHVVKMIGTIQDITERKQAEEELKLRAQILDNATDSIFVHDYDDNFIYVNEAACRIHGYTREEFSKIKLPQLVDPKRSRPLALDRQIMRKKGHLVVESAHLRKDGSIVPVEVHARTIGSGRSKLFLTVARDITERKRMEEALRDSEEKLRKMFESVTEGISVIDLKGSIIEVNQRAVEMHGFSSKDELRGKSAFELVAPRDHERIAAHMKKAIKQEAIRSVEYTLLRADGSEFPGELSTNVLKDASDNVVGHITIVRDITERKRAEEEREALLQDITKSNQKLEGANKELQDFAYVASHDLREPLRKISSFGTLLQDSLKGKLDEDQQENFEFMIDGAQRMQDMIDDLLTYSRLTTRAKPPQQVFLNEVIENVKKFELATLLDETRGTIHIPEPLPPVQADSSQMNQLFQNLIGNGLKFHKEGIPPEITIRAHGVENKMIRIEVEDNGIGIDEKYHEQLFVMFKRLHSRAEYEGTGIGLAVCKKIVERHGGNIGIKSTPGKGSTFWFTLPRGSYLKEN